MARLLPLVALLLVALCLPTTAAAGKRPSVPAKWMKAQKLTPAKARKDLDRDGLSTWGEWRSKTNPRKADSDGDGRPDSREDRDRDGLANGFELLARTDPAKPDTDGDRRRDGREDADRDGLDHAAEAKFGYGPRTRDSDRDGVRDGDENPGVVRTVAGPLVTIALARGGTLVAAYGDDTEVDCASALDDAADAELEPGEEITGDEELLEETGEEVAEEVAELAQLDDAEDDEAFDGEGDDPSLPGDDPSGEDADPADCGATLRPGDLVRSARTTPGPAGLLLAELELLAP